MSSEAADKSEEEKKPTGMPEGFLEEIRVYEVIKDVGELAQKGDILYELFDLPNHVRPAGDLYIESHVMSDYPISLDIQKFLSHNTVELLNTVPVSEDKWFQARVKNYYSRYLNGIIKKIYRARIELQELEDSAESVGRIIRFNEPAAEHSN